MARGNTGLLTDGERIASKAEFNMEKKRAPPSPQARRPEYLPSDVGIVVLPGEKGRARALREDGDVGSGAGQFAPDRKEIFQLWILNESSVDFFSEAY